MFGDLRGKRVLITGSSGGIGLADVLMRQMSKNKAAVPGEAAATTALTAEAKAPAATTVDSPFVRSSGQRPLWASRVAITPQAAGGGHQNDMALLNQRQQTRNVGWVMLAICVHEHDDFALGRARAGLDGRAVAFAVGVADDFAASLPSNG